MAKKKSKSKATKKSSGGAKKSGGDFIVKSKVKEYLSKSKCFSSSDVVESLNCVVQWYLEQAAKRAKANKRKTVRGHDFMAC